MASLAHPSKFQRVSRLAFDTAATSLIPTKLCTMFGHRLLHYIYIFGGSCQLTEFCPVQNSLYVQVLRFPILATLLHDSKTTFLSWWDFAGFRGKTQYWKEATSDVSVLCYNFSNSRQSLLEAYTLPGWLGRYKEANFELHDFMYAIVIARPHS